MVTFACCREARGEARENATPSRPGTHQKHRAVARTSRQSPLGPEQALQRPDPTATAQERPHHGFLVCSAGKARGEARENVTSGRPGTHRGHRAVARTSHPRPSGPEQALQRRDPTATAQERPCG